MASFAKRRAVGMGKNPNEDEDDSSDERLDDDEEVTSEESDEEINEEVVVDFEAHTISVNDFNGMKKLLQQLFLKAHVNTSELTDLMIQQNHIGSVIRQAEVPEDSDEDDSDPNEVFGFISMINLTERKGVECVEQIKELILAHCEKACPPTVTEQLEKYLNDTAKPVGLLLSERFINVPPQIALPLHTQLQEEILDAQRTNKPSGKCHYFLMISKTCKEVQKTIPNRGTPKEEMLFVNAEEEFFHEQATMKFQYSVQDETDSCLSGRWSFDDVPMKPYRTVMLIPMDRMGVIMDKLKQYLTI
ncbi:protein BCCIP homolog [Clupea harengus]|uniref:Protein BCCIP homolog n=1 Tax=Clupea harengus TaxID=7950 RepID=A0A6P3W2N0_CLUHA|nr:protein BCCIP homolog [Clupea harengus]